MFGWALKSIADANHLHLLNMDKQEEAILKALSPMETLAAISRQPSESSTGTTINFNYTIIFRPVISGTTTKEASVAIAVPSGIKEDDDEITMPSSATKAPRSSKKALVTNPSTYTISEEDAKSIETPQSARSRFDDNYYEDVRKMHLKKNNNQEPSAAEMQKYLDDGWNNSADNKEEYSRIYEKALKTHKRNIEAFEKKYPGWLKARHDDEAVATAPPSNGEDSDEDNGDDDDDDLIEKTRRECPYTVAALERPRPRESSPISRSKRKKKPKVDGPKGASNAYVHFTTVNRAKYKEMDEYKDMNAIHLTPIIAERWKDVKKDPELLKPYKDMEIADRKRYNREWYEYMKKNIWKWIEWKITTAHRKSWRTWKTTHAQWWEEWKEEIPDADVIDMETSECNRIIPKIFFADTTTPSKKRSLEGASPPKKRRKLSTLDPVVKQESSMDVVDHTDLPNPGRSLPIPKMEAMDDDEEEDDLTDMWNPVPPVTRKGRRNNNIKKNKRRMCSELQKSSEKDIQDIEDEFMETFDYDNVD